MDNFDFIECRICNKKFKSITNTHLWREHQITIEDYLDQFPDAPLKSEATKIATGSGLRGKTYEEVMGKEKADQLKKFRSECASRQMENPEQIKIRNEKCGYEMTNEIKEKISEKTTIHGGFSYRRKALDFYGLECQRCGLSSENEKDFVVHHKNLQNIPSELGDHSIENLGVYCKPCHAKLHQELDNTTSRFTGISNVERGVHYILKGLKQELNLDLKDLNFRDTPKRVARAYREIFEGVKDTDKKISEILSTAFPSGGYESMIVCYDIKSFSMCPHHLLPVEYKVSIGYIPSKEGQVLGASKLARVVELLSQRPVLQETLTQEIVESLAIINPLGVAVVVEGTHFCMKMRGIKNNSTFHTSAMSGAFMEDLATRNEFFEMLKISKMKNHG